MLDLTQYDCLGAALRDALERFAGNLCLIEADRDRENHRLTYRQFRDQSLPIARALEELGFGAGSRAAILMSNQSKWLMAAYAIFHRGGVLVPLDAKLCPQEHVELLLHSKAEILFVEYPLWRALRQAPSFAAFQPRAVFVTEAPAGAEMGGARRWEDCQAGAEPALVVRRRQDWAAIVYSSGTGGRPKGCLITHENYLEQCRGLIAWYPFRRGDRYLSILPTNHAIDFMVGFIGPFVCGAAVVHLRTVRPEFIREAFRRFRITYACVVPLLLKNVARGLGERFDELAPGRRRALDALIAVNRALVRRRPHPRLSRLLLPQVHRAFGGKLKALIVGGAFTEPAILQLLYDLGIPVANGYGLTEACTAVTVNDLKPFRADTVGKPLPGVEIQITEPDADGVGEVKVRGKTVMAGYLGDPALTAETSSGGWLRTGDLGWVDRQGHLHLVGRKKNMIVTEGGKNVYPEDIERVFEGLPAKEFCVYAANYLWPRRELGGETLVLVAHPDGDQAHADSLRAEIGRRNRQLADFKRVAGLLVWNHDFPRTASLKIKRPELARQIAERTQRSAVIEL
ncbi:MAG TPA: AMP-binding protein [Candidatus Acidoferrales bacterium]|nr:AMP-binding protein [Candidatus Acidoferrales bacterium]